MLIEVYSDVVCPWCYLGLRRLQRAVAAQDGDVTVVFRPFQLDPGALPTPEPVRSVYEAKFGGPERAAEIIDHVTAIGATEGLDLRLDRALRSNTLAAHRLLWFAARHGHQAPLVERLFRAYFTEGRDVGDPAELARLAGDAGLDEAMAAAFLASHEGVDEVRADVATAHAMGITAVPTFVFEGRWAVSGAHDPVVLAGVLDQVRDRLAEELAVEADVAAAPASGATPTA
jgi:predicted DsbA family dithiol-disulfide isomerase